MSSEESGQNTTVTPGYKPGATANPVRRQPGTVANRKPQRSHRGLLINASLTSALEALWSNRLRSLLTILGVIVGVAAVIVAVTITEGTSANINSRVAGLGTNVLTINSGAAVSGGASQGVGSEESLTVSDATAIAAVPHVVNVTPIKSVSAQLVYSGQNWSTRAEGVYPNYQQIDNWSLAEGSWFSQADEDAGTPVAVLGQTTEQNLFTGVATDPVGQTILINGNPFNVVGILRAKGTSGAVDQDDIVYVPYSAAQDRLKDTPYADQIQVQVDTADDVATAEANITTVLDQQHNIAPGGTADFVIRSSDQLIQTAQSTGQTLAFLLIGIAAVSLLVGGIGIMNIMLVSVTERTREIGIRMAVGARRGDIRNQFLIEALTLSAAGGIIGIVAGLIGGYIMTNAFSLPFAPSLPSIVLAFGVSAIIGVCFGFYPAVRASRLDPIVALHTD
ncbi:MAG: ABC transporter permease [Ktedonobacterales bacterium]